MILGFKIEFKWEIPSFSPYTEYEFGVLAVNNVGRGKKSIAALATTGETSGSSYNLSDDHDNGIYDEDDDNEDDDDNDKEDDDDYCQQKWWVRDKNDDEYDLVFWDDVCTCAELKTAKIFPNSCRDFSCEHFWYSELCADTFLLSISDTSIKYFWLISSPRNELYSCNNVSFGMALKTRISSLQDDFQCEMTLTEVSWDSDQ